MRSFFMTRVILCGVSGGFEVATNTVEPTLFRSCSQVNQLLIMCDVGFFLQAAPGNYG